jgi:ATP phosphoribosyltransferase regulatory subunit
MADGDTGDARAAGRAISMVAALPGAARILPGARPRRRLAGARVRARPARRFVATFRSIRCSILAAERPPGARSLLRWRAMTEPVRSAVRLPPGVRDFLPRAAARRRGIAEKLLAEFEAWGYARIITPMFECADVLERGLGQDARQAAIRFVEPGTGEVVALRPDITPQVARMAATRLADRAAGRRGAPNSPESSEALEAPESPDSPDSIDGPLRYCYEGAVTRMQRGARMQREILQAGVELIGAGAPDGDAEVIALAATALATMGIDHVRLDLGHVALARHALAAIEDTDRRAEIETLLAKKAHREVARAAATLPAPLRALLSALPTLYGAPSEVLGRARALAWPAPVRRAIDTVEAVLALSREVVESELHATITLDLGEMRGFEYYTGIRFAGYADGVGEPVLQGGRYDELVGRYGHPAQATGFAVDIEAIAQAQQARGVALPPAATAILVATTKQRRQEGMRVAAALRARGLRAAVDLGQRRGRRALVAYASEAGFTRVLGLETGGAQMCRLADIPEGNASGERRPGAGPGAGTGAGLGEWSAVAHELGAAAAPGDAKALAALVAGAAGAGAAAGKTRPSAAPVAAATRYAGRRERRA